MDEHPRNTLRMLARGQRSLFTTAQAREAGVTDRVRARLVAQGEIVTLHPKVHRFVAAPWDWEAVQHAAVLAGGPSAVLSHAPAGRLLGLSVPYAGRPEITVPSSGTPRLNGVRVHRTRDLPEDDVTVVAGIPCTSGPRTLVDLAARLPWARCVRLVDEAVCAGVASRATLHARASALCNGRAGVRPILDTTSPHAEGGFWSALERAFAEGLRARGIPEPAWNTPLRIDGRLLYPDALWDPHRLVAELHGLRFHHTPADRESDDERFNLFTLAGYRVLVFTWEQVFTAFDHVAARLRRAMAAPLPV